MVAIGEELEFRPDDTMTSGTLRQRTRAVHFRFTLFCTLRRSPPPTATTTKYRRIKQGLPLAFLWAVPWSPCSLYSRHPSTLFLFPPPLPSILDIPSFIPVIPPPLLPCTPCYENLRIFTPYFALIVNFHPTPLGKFLALHVCPSCKPPRAR